MIVPCVLGDTFVDEVRDFRGYMPLPLRAAKLNDRLTSFILSKAGIWVEGGKLRTIIAHFRIKIGKDSMVTTKTIPLLFANRSKATSIFANGSINNPKFCIEAENIYL